MRSTASVPSERRARIPAAEAPWFAGGGGRRSDESGRLGPLFPSRRRKFRFDFSSEQSGWLCSGLGWRTVFAGLE